MEGFTGNGGTFRDFLHMYWAAERKNQDFFEKSPFFSDRLPKFFEYKAWKISSVVNVSRFFAYVRDAREAKSELFLKKVWFSLIVCRKNLNKGDEGLRRDHRWMTVSRTCPDERNRKIFENFSENRGHFATCLAVTPIESFCARAKKSRFLSEKSGFLLSVFQKNANIRLGKIVRHGKLAVRDFFSFFFGKRRFFTEHLPKKTE